MKEDMKLNKNFSSADVVFFDASQAFLNLKLGKNDISKRINCTTFRVALSRHAFILKLTVTRVALNRFHNKGCNRTLNV